MMIQASSGAGVTAPKSRSRLSCEPTRRLTDVLFTAAGSTNQAFKEAPAT